MRRTPPAKPRFTAEIAEYAEQDYVFLCDLGALCGERFCSRPNNYSACLVTFNNTPMQARVMKSDDPP